MLRHLFVVAILVATPALAGSRIPAADLAEVEASALDELRATEFEVFLAEVAMHTARQAEAAAQQALRNAKRSMQGEVLDLKAARAEQRAAQVDADTARRSAASDSVRKASHDKDSNDLLIEWKEKALRATRLTVEHARLRQQLAGVRRDLARSRALQGSDSSVAAKYPVASYEKESIQLQRSYDNALQKTEKAGLEADRLGDRWSRQSGR